MVADGCPRVGSHLGPVLNRGALIIRMGFFGGVNIVYI